jgi:hypothetical protein
VNFNAIDMSVWENENGAYPGGDTGLEEFFGFLLAEAYYTVSVEQTTGSPVVDGQPLSQVPLSITAQAQASVEQGLGAFGAWADLLCSPSPSIYYPSGSTGEAFGGPNTEEFNVQQTCWVTPGEYISVDLGADIWAEATGDSVTELTAEVDPTITLDQAAFNAEYPGSNITLSDYYQIDYSPNMNSPEPSTLTLLGIPLALAGYAGRRRKGKA